MWFTFYGLWKGISRQISRISRQGLVHRRLTRCLADAGVLVPARRRDGHQICPYLGNYSSFFNSETHIWKPEQCTFKKNIKNLKEVGGVSGGGSCNAMKMQAHNTENDILKRPSHERCFKKISKDWEFFWWQPKVSRSGHKLDFDHIYQGLGVRIVQKAGEKRDGRRDMLLRSPDSSPGISQ